MTNDQLQRYTFPQQHVRGELVQLETSFSQLLETHTYPEPIQKLLGEMLVAATLLSATLKFKGEISLQVQSQGLIKYAVVDVTHDQKVRGIARWKEQKTRWPTEFQHQFSKGVLAITITPDKGERYQGLVSLDKSSLAECLEDYFTQSEQLATRVLLHTDTQSNQLKAGGLLVQILPQSSEATDASQHNHFNDLVVLTETMTAEELFNLDAQTLLYRLYHEYEVELYPPTPVTFACTCSKARSAEALKNIEKSELLKIIAEEGAIRMDCQYCNAQYVFDQMDVESIHAGFGHKITNGEHHSLS
jgi:molecular chaperone Hsp33